MKLHERLSRALMEGYPEEAARLLEQVSPEERVATLLPISPQAVARVLQSMDSVSSGACLMAWPADGVGRVLACVPPQIAARLLERTGTPGSQALLDRIPPEASAPIQQLLRRAEGTAGALMDPKTFSVPDDIRVGEARKRLGAHDVHGLYYLYVVDRAHRLVGVMNMDELIRARSAATVSRVMRRDVSSLSVHAGSDAILAHPAWSDHHALPVVDRGGLLVGVLRYGTMRILEDQARARGGELGPPGFGMMNIYVTTASALLDGVMGWIKTHQPPSGKTGDPR